MNLRRYALSLFKKAYPWLGWPDGWNVYWKTELDGAFGLVTYDEKKIEICRNGHSDKARKFLDDTLVHEMTHMVYGPDLRHGRSFSQKVRRAKERAGV